MIRFQGVTKTYPIGAGLTVLRHVDLAIERRECVGVVGPSGSGKSTLLHIMGLLDRPTAGRVEFDGRDVSRLGDDDLSGLRGRLIGFVFQSFYLVPHLTVVENVELPLFYQRVSRGERRARAEKCLSEVHLSARGHHRPSQLSGGESQRVAIARALVTDPELVLADEPTGNLDSRTGGDIMKILRVLNERGRTLVIITHDESIAARLPRIVRIHDGEVREDTGAGGRWRDAAEGEQP